MPGPHAPIRLCLPPAPADRARISMPGPHAPIRLRLPPVPAARADVSVPGPPAPIRLRVRPVPAARTEISAPGPHAPIRLNLRPVPAARLSHRNRTETSVRTSPRAMPIGAHHRLSQRPLHRPTGAGTRKFKSRHDGSLTQRSIIRYTPRRVTPPHRGASLLKGRAVMAIAAKPDMRPANPNFSSGPCAKRPGFTLDALSGALLGRSHRAAAAEGAAGRGDRPLARHPGHARRLAARHRAGLRHRRDRDGAVVAARRPRRRCRWPSKASAKAGPPTSSSS